MCCGNPLSFGAVDASPEVEVVRGEVAIEVTLSMRCANDGSLSKNTGTVLRWILIT